jgi:hypothetical protein
MESFKPIKMKAKENWDDSDEEMDIEEEIIEAGPVDEAVDSEDEDDEKSPEPDEGKKLYSGNDDDYEDFEDEDDYDDDYDDELDQYDKKLGRYVAVKQK